MNSYTSFIKGQKETTLNKVRKSNIKFAIDEDMLKKDYENPIKVLKKLCNEISEAFFVNRGILFVDPKKNITKPQSRVDLITIR